MSTPKKAVTPQPAKRSHHKKPAPATATPVFRDRRSAGVTGVLRNRITK